MAGKHFHGDLFPVKGEREYPEEWKEYPLSGCTKNQPYESENRNPGFGGK